MAIRKYIRDEKGRFAKVANNHPEGTFFHNMSAADQKAVNNQEKRDRAKARAEKAKLFAAAEKNTQPVQPKEQEVSPFAAQMNAHLASKNYKTPSKPQKDYYGNTIPSPAATTSPTPEVKVGAALDNTPEGKAKARAEAKRARAKARREKAKNALDDNTQPVTVTAAPKAAKPAKAGPSPEQQQYRQESAKLKESHAKVKKLEEDLNDLYHEPTKYDYNTSDGGPAYQAKKDKEKYLREQLKVARQEVTEQKKVVAEAKAKVSTGDETPEQEELRKAKLEYELAAAEAKAAQDARNAWNTVGSLSPYQLAANHNAAVAKRGKAKDRLELAQAKVTLAAAENPAAAKKSRGSAAVQEAQAKVAAATIEFKQAQAEHTLLKNKHGNYWSLPPTERFAAINEVNKASSREMTASLELDKAKKNLVEVRVREEKATETADSTEWVTQTRRMNSEIALSDVKYKKEDEAFRKKLGQRTFNSDTGKTETTGSELSPDLRKAHTDYTHATYRYMNDSLREGNVDKPTVGNSYIDNYWGKRGGMRKLVDSMSELINEHGNETDEHTVVMRGIRGKDNYHPAEIYAEGSVVEEKSFLSTTVAKHIQTSFAGKRSWKGDKESWAMYIRLQPKTRYVHGNKVESEMILDKGTKFRVVKVDKEKNQIFLQHVTD